MEALAIKTIVERGCSLGWERIICESDSQIVVDILNSQNLENVSWQLAIFARQTLSLCNFLDSISFCHIPREWNRVADFLAKWASENDDGWDISGREELLAEFSQTIEQLILGDMNM